MKSKAIVSIMRLFFLFSFLCTVEAGSIAFPGTDVDGTPYSLAAFGDHITIFGGVYPSNLPLQYPIENGRFSKCGGGTGICFVITPSSSNIKDIAARNAWLAMLLKASSTGNSAEVSWHDNDEDAATCLTIAGAICAVSTQ